MMPSLDELRVCEMTSPAAYDVPAWLASSGTEFVAPSTSVNSTRNPSSGTVKGAISTVTGVYPDGSS